MSRGQARGCFPEGGQSDGCFPEAATVPSRFKCWIDGVPDRPGRKDRSTTARDDASSPKRLLKYLTRESG